MNKQIYGTYFSQNDARGEQSRLMDGYGRFGC